MHEDFTILKNAFAYKLQPLHKAYWLSRWNFYTNSSEENMARSIAAKKALQKLYQDKKLYKLFKEVDLKSLSLAEQGQLKHILKEFEEQNQFHDQKEELDLMEAEIAKKYNSYTPKIDNKPVSSAQIYAILQTSEDTNLRAQAYQAKLDGGNLIAEDLRKLVIKRNEYAQNFGYNDFFEYHLKEEFDVDIQDLNNLMELVYSSLKTQIKTVYEQKNTQRKKAFGVSVLEPHHCDLLPKIDPDKKVNDYLISAEQIVDIAKHTYQRMGYNIDSLIAEGRLTLDLFPRNKKNTHAFSFDIESGKDLRILANLTNNVRSLLVLHHELGHCVYDLGFAKDMCFLDKSTYPAVTEAVAMMMESLQKRENVLGEVVPKSVLQGFKSSWAADDLLYLGYALTLINFEREMYKNPNQDLKKLWRDMRVKFRGADKQETPDNAWATIPHFLSYPVYYQNYFRAQIIREQIYEHLTSTLGPVTENPNTADYLKQHLFQYGVSLTQDELIKNLTGHNISPDTLIKSVSHAFPTKSPSEFRER